MYRHAVVWIIYGFNYIGDFVIVIWDWPELHAKLCNWCRLETDRKWFLSYGRNRKAAESMQTAFGRNRNKAESWITSFGRKPKPKPKVRMFTVSVRKSKSLAFNRYSLLILNKIKQLNMPSWTLEFKRKCNKATLNNFKSAWINSIKRRKVYVTRSIASVSVWLGSWSSSPVHYIAQTTQCSTTS